MRAGLSLLLVCLVCSRLWGQSDTLDRPQTLVFSRAYLEERLSALVGDALLSPEEALAHEERYESLRLVGIDLNRISLEELREVPLVSEHQAYQFVQYRREQGGRIEGAEALKLISGWDEDFILYLTPLLREQSAERTLPTWSALLGAGQGRLSLLAKRPMGREDSEQYLGSPEYLSLQYQWHSGEHLSAFVGAEKDSYEPWRYGRHRGFDSYHGHLGIKNISWIKTLILGQYRASWGEGLVLNQGFSTKSLLHAGGSPRGHYRGLSSTSEYRLSQGAVCQLSLSKHLSLAALASSIRLDGSPSESEELIGAISEGGLHHTPRAWRRRGLVLQRHWGGSLSLQYPRWSLSLNALVYDWGGRRLGKAPGVAYHEGLSQLKGFSNLSLSYQYSSLRGHIQTRGEVARSRNGAWAFSSRTGLWGELWGRLQLALRYIGADYWAYHASSLTHFGRPHNEVGLAWAYQPMQFIAKTQLSLEGDLYRSLGERGRGVEKGGYLRLSAEHRLGRKYRLHIRSSYSWDNNRKASKWSLRSALNYRSKAWVGSLFVEGKQVASDRSDTSWGYLISGRIAYTTATRLRIATQISYHDIPLWQGRIYLPESRLAGEYGMTNLYGKGFRLMALASGRLSRRLSLGIKATYQHRKPRATTPLSLGLHLAYKL